MKRLLKKAIYSILRHRGFTRYISYHFMNLIIEDFTKAKLPLKQKIWAYKRGFISHRIIDYKLNNNNYSDYLSDYDYYRMHPINVTNSWWIDDKMTTKYILAPFDEFLPAYYFMLNKGTVTRMMNAGTDFEGSIESIIKKTKSEGALAFKEIAGSGGEGFYKIEYINDKFLVNGVEKSGTQITDFILSLDNYLVMEYIVPHEELKKYYPNSPGVLRVMVINEGTPAIVNAYFRVGTTSSGYIDANNGSISAVVDLDTGGYNDAYLHNGKNFVKIEEHPDSKLRFEGVIPKWGFVKEKILEISNYIPQLKYMGFDVCVTNDGFKLFEINSHQGIELFQISYPLLKNNPAAEFFRREMIK